MKPSTGVLVLGGVLFVLPFPGTFILGGIGILFGLFLRWFGI